MKKIYYNKIIIAFDINQYMVLYTYYKIMLEVFRMQQSQNAVP